ncbi:3'-5' exonuclease [Olivibacter sp. CPCC 100613]|uniref:3'-5' exonuclease n=1 Tax=Olivibacter sp. CPCC 100613 TaxID=3079931 RepID=UPI002FFBC497
MQEYLLFIDTETTGLPKKWTVAYSAKDNWPSAVQIAWILFTKEGKEIKRENFYVNEDDMVISGQAQQVHQIDHAYLRRFGVPRCIVMEKLSDDLRQFEPLVVGHFVALDCHVLGADFYRCAMENPFLNMRLFCTMIASSRYVKKPWIKYLRLNELYQELFEKELEKAHNALTDAEATAKSYFELIKRRDITEKTILDQQSKLSKQLLFSKPSLSMSRVVIILLLLLSVLFCLIIFKLE